MILLAGYFNIETMVYNFKVLTLLKTFHSGLIGMEKAILESFVVWGGIQPREPLSCQSMTLS